MRKAIAGLVVVLFTAGIASASDGFADVPSDQVFASQIEWLASAGITKGCNPPSNDMFCPNDAVSRGQMAAFLVRALGLDYIDPDVGFVDTSGSVFKSDILKLASAGITKGCNPPDNDRYCPERTLTRGQMAAFLYRAVEEVPEVIPGLLPDATRGVVYSAKLNASGGAPPYTWAVPSTPPGLSLDADGTLTGTPAAAGDYLLEATATDTNGRSAAGAITLQIDEPLMLITDVLPQGTTDEMYTTTLEATGGEPPYTWSASGFPDGLSLDGHGSMSGIPTTAGDYTVLVIVTDADGRHATETFSCEIVDVLSVATRRLQEGTVGESYNVTLTASSGEPPYTWSVDGLPEGLEFDTDGHISGVPTGTGSSEVKVVVTDSATDVASATLTLDVCEPLNITSSWLPDGTVGEGYSHSVVAEGGHAPYSWTAVTPAGLWIDQAGALTGSPETAGTYTVEVTVADSGGRSDTEWLALDVDDPLVIPFGVFFDGEIYQPYGMLVDALGGEPPYSWSAEWLPPGLSLSDSGSLTGTPMVLGNYPVELTVSDSDGRSTTRTVTLFLDGIDRVSESSYGLTQGNNNSESGNISADGRYVVFASKASNLVPGDIDNTYDIYLYDTYTQIQKRVSVSYNEAEVDAIIGSPDVDNSGTRIVFTSDSPDLVFGDNNASFDVFLRDLDTNHTYLASLGSQGLIANGDSSDGMISDDGNRIMFLSDATNLAVGDTNGIRDLFVNDRTLHQTWRVNVSTEGEQANGVCSSGMDLSGDGRWATFACVADNLVPNDTNFKADVFLRDIDMGVTYLVSKTPLGLPANGSSENPTVSADGRYVVYTSYASNLTGDDEDGTEGSLFIYDRVTDTTEMISRGYDGTQFASLWSAPVSADGRFIAVTTGDDYVVPDDNNGTYDAFVIDRATGAIERLSDPLQSGGDLIPTYVRDISNNGIVVMYSFSDYLVPDDTNGYRDVFISSVDTKH